MIRRIIILMLLTAFLPDAATAVTFSIEYDGMRVRRQAPIATEPVVGLALSGGGARGLAHIGVIDVLEDAGIRVERIAGTSMGSIIGGLYAAGYTPAAMQDIVLNMDWSGAFSNEPPRHSIYIGEKESSRWPLFELRFQGFRAQIPSSLSSGQRIISFLSWLTLEATYASKRDFDRLPIPFKAITTDLETGRKITLGYGNLGRAMQASSTIPLLFSPVRMDERLLVDGGLKDNIPISTVRDMGSDFVIAVAIEESMHSPRELDNPLNIADQATSILMRNISEMSRQGADFTISPDMEAYSSREFAPAEDMIEQGRVAARAALPALKETLTAADETKRLVRVSRIDITPEEAVSGIGPVAGLRLREGSLVGYDDITATLEALWATGRYVSVTAELDEHNQHLAIDAVPAPPNALLRLVTTGGDVEQEVIEFPFTITRDGEPSIHVCRARADSLVRASRLAGYSFAAIREADFEPGDDEIVIRAEAPRITRVMIDDGLTSRRALIMRETEVSVGDVMDLGKVMQWVENLYGTTMYELVWVDVDPYDDGVGLRMHLREKDWTVARFGLRYDESMSSEGRVDLIRENILGFGNQLLVTGHFGQRRNLFMVGSRNNRIYSSLYSFNIKTYRQFWKRRLFEESYIHDYDDERYGNLISIGQQMDKLGNALFQFKAETVLTRYPDFSSRRNAQKELRSFVVRTLIDSYDRYPFPREGFVNQIYIESAMDILGGSEQYAKIYWGGSFAHSYLRKHTFGGGFALGTADPSIPDIESFSLGGDTTRLNCYDWSSTASHFYAPFPGLADEERFGTRLTVGTVYYRLFIPRQFYLDLIYSAGNAWPRGREVTAKGLIHGFGIAGSFSTFAGPLRFGWGKTSEQDEHVFMSAGWEF